jgi:hypothetical protein
MSSSALAQKQHLKDYFIENTEHLKIDGKELKKCKNKEMMTLLNLSKVTLNKCVPAYGFFFVAMEARETSAQMEWKCRGGKLADE